MHYNTQNRKQEQDTKKRLGIIHQYYLDHPGCTINQAVTFIPETESMVKKYSKNREEYVVGYNDNRDNIRGN